MKRTTLSPRDAAWLADTFARNRVRFGGWSMEADDPKPDDKPADPKADDDPAGSDDGKGSKSAVLADLAKERKARQALEAQVADLTPIKEQMAALAAALGGKSDDGAEGDDGDAVAKIQQRLDDIQHENAVLALANEHRITDKDDLELLRGTRDAEKLVKLAERLAPSEDDDTGKKPRNPKPDGSQGGGDASDSKPSVAAGRDMFAASRKKKSA